jgi:hypothetical protein
VVWLSCPRCAEWRYCVAVAVASPVPQPASPDLVAVCPPAADPVAIRACLTPDVAAVFDAEWAPFDVPTDLAVRGAASLDQRVLLCDRTPGLYYDDVSAVADDTGENDVEASIDDGRVASIKSWVTINVEVAATRHRSPGAGSSYDCLQALTEIEDPVRSIYYLEHGLAAPII